MAGLIENDGIRVLRRALDGLSLRQQVIGNNVANVDTPGFKAGEAQFEGLLRRVLAGGGRDALPLATSHAGHLAGGPPDLQPEVITLNSTARADGNSVDIDREMSLLAETQIEYSAATRLVNTKLALLRSIVTDGRR